MQVWLCMQQPQHTLLRVARTRQHSRKPLVPAGAFQESTELKVPVASCVGEHQLQLRIVCSCSCFTTTKNPVLQNPSLQGAFIVLPRVPEHCTCFTAIASLSCVLELPDT